MMIAVSQTKLREAEAQAVARLLARAHHEPAVLVVEGEAGIGKTTLLLHAASQAESLGFVVLRAHGSPLEVSYAYVAVADLLGEVDDAVLGTLTERHRLALHRARVSSDIGGAATDEKVTAAAFCAVIEQLSHRSPVLLAIDDAQWLDPSSRAVIGFAARRLNGHTALLLTLRTEAGAAGLWPAFPDPDVVTRIQIRPHNLDDLHALITARLGRALPRPSIARIHALCGGNPMFAVEMARAHLDNPEATDLPDALTALVQRRLTYLDGASQTVLLAAACSAAPTVSLLSRALDLPTDEVITSLEQAEAIGVVTFDNTKVSFTHPMFAAGAAASATPARRRAMHQALAAVVNEPELRARHLALATVTLDEPTLAALDAASDSLASRGALAAAADLAGSAIKRGGDTAARRIRAAELYFRSGSVASARTHLQAALRAAPSGALRALALAHLAAVSAYDDDLSGAISTLTEAAEAAADAPMLRLLCQIRLSLALAIAGQMTETVNYARHAIALAEQLDAPGLRSQALSVWVTAQFIQGHGVDRAALRTALELEDSASGATTFLRAGAVRAVTAAYLGDLDTAETQLREVKDTMAADGNEIELVWIDNRLAAVAIWSGRYAEAVELAEAAVQRAQQLGARLSLLTARTKRAAVAAYQGREDDARADVVAAVSAAQVIGAHRQITEPLRVAAFLEVSRGDYAAAIDTLQPLLQQFDPPRELEIEGGEHLPDAVEALIAVGDHRRADEIVTALEQHGADRDRPWMMAVAARGRGALLAASGDLPAAQHALEEALKHHGRLPMPFERARTQLVLGQVERRRRQRSSAALTLTDAVSTFDDLGARRWASRARAELDRLTITRGAGRELSAAERRTAELAAQGLSNRDIAVELFRAEKTIEATLSSVYRKLGIRSRAALAAHLASLPD